MADMRKTIASCEGVPFVDGPLRSEAAQPSLRGPSNAFIEVQDVVFVYPETEKAVLDHTSLDAPSGAVTCLMGVNGCGKSTLIDCVLGVNRISGGRILIDGEDAATLRPAALARRLAYVPQVHDRAFPYRVRDVVLMGRTVHHGILGAPGEEDRALVDEALRRCGIAHLAERSYTQLSGGEMQMVLLARALAQATPFILMDEPTAHLDFKNELFFMETVVHLVREQGVGVLVATHSPNQAFFFEGMDVPCTCALMDEGRVRFMGRPSDVLTAANLRELYGVRAQVVGAALEDGRSLNQILLIATE